MIDHDTAADLAGRVLSRGDLELTAFQHGWLVQPSGDRGRRGAPTIVVEHATGAVLAFPSGVPRRRVTDDYEQVRVRAVPLG